jgi:Fe-S-cluster containining protein
MTLLSSNGESEICLSCGECCKRYYITLLKDDGGQRISKKLKLSKKNFLEKYCELHVKIFPKTTKGILTFPTVFFPQAIGEKIKNVLGYSPESFFVLPQIVLKRNEGSCTFLRNDNSCVVYSARPEPCKLFPFIVLPGYRESYPFCELFQKTNKDYSKKSSSYYKKVKKYFKEIDRKGFTSYWKTPPLSGKIFLNETLIGEINLKELELMLSLGNKSIRKEKFSSEKNKSKVKIKKSNFLGNKSKVKLNSNFNKKIGVEKNSSMKRGRGKNSVKKSSVQKSNMSKVI